MGARRLWALPLPAHALALMLALLALAPFLRLDAPFTSDEGAYGLQVRALSEGRWEYDYRAADLDPDGRWFPIMNTERTDRGWFTYAKHPAWPRALAAQTGVLGDGIGLYALTLLGAVLTAVAAWLLAGELAPGAGLERTGFWVAAAGPVLVNAYVLWAHAPSAALGGLALVAAIRVVRNGVRPAPLLAIAVCAGLGVLVRSEGLLFAGALAAGSVIAGVAVRRGLAGVAVATVTGTAAAGALLGDRIWSHAVMGDGPAPFAARDSAVPWLEGRLRGGAHVLLQGAHHDSRAALWSVAALVAVIGAGWLLRRRSARTARPGLALALLAAGAYALRLHQAPAEPVTGLLVAWPLAALALLLGPWRAASQAMRLIAAVSALFTVAVLATQYAEGGGSEWGGRFLSPLAAPLAAVAVVAIRRVLDALPAVDRRPVMAAVAVLAVVPVVLGLVVVRSQRGAAEGVIRDVASGARAPVVVTTYAYLPRAMWRDGEDWTWLLADEAEVPTLLVHLHRQGVDDVAVVGSDTLALGHTGYDVVDDVTGPALRRIAARMVILEA